MLRLDSESQITPNGSTLHGSSVGIRKEEAGEFLLKTVDIKNVLKTHLESGNLI